MRITISNETSKEYYHKQKKLKKNTTIWMIISKNKFIM